MSPQNEHDDHVVFICEETPTLELALQLHLFLLCPQHLKSKKKNQSLKLLSGWVKGMYLDYHTTHIFLRGYMIAPIPLSLPLTIPKCLKEVEQLQHRELDLFEFEGNPASVFLPL